MWCAVISILINGLSAINLGRKGGENAEKKQSDVKQAIAY